MREMGKTVERWHKRGSDSNNRAKQQGKQSLATKQNEVLPYKVPYKVLAKENIILKYNMIKKLD